METARITSPNGLREHGCFADRKRPLQQMARYHADNGPRGMYGPSPCILFDSEERPNDTVYLDRMMQWDWDKYNAAAMRCWGTQQQVIDNLTAEQVEAFMSEYLGKPVELCKITRTTGQFNGYWYYQLDYRLLDCTPEKGTGSDAKTSLANAESSETLKPKTTEQTGGE